MHHFVRERIARGEITFDYCSRKEMVADALTKTLPKPLYAFCCSHVGLEKYWFDYFMLHSSLLVWECCESMVVRVHFVFKLVA
jgi:hypothetical protein